ncbi:hypothetical protein [Methanobrevibacter sp.]
MNKMELPDPDQIYRLAEAYKKMYDNKVLRWGINKGLKYYMKDVEPPQNTTTQNATSQNVKSHPKPDSDIWNRFSFTVGLPVVPLVKLGVRWSIPSYLARYLVPLMASGVSAYSVYKLYKYLRSTKPQQKSESSPIL